MNPIEKLSELFSRFPGIGRRQARRFVYFLLSADGGFVEDLLKEITTLREVTKQCTDCYRFFADTGGRAEGLCSLCGSQNINKKIVMIVEKDIDLENILRSKTYDGQFFVLGGLLSLLENSRRSDIRAKELLAGVEKRVQSNELEEVVIALSAHPEGEHTKMYLEKILNPFAEKHGVKITTLGRGLSTGTELEYSDADTIKNALESRR
ncbi:MAG: hypothetical protein A2912_03655 [Candidatus Buchananbacteria bacterium RIFCSPLOWO2_01_FULL_40_23b]|uniref:Recombination protein RecR n=1 Tax=Candidatus Buchananbacteria bacterium RIFCSPLOWO2_01_FULL_40_23b TaxID=1797544 RepID=A0A1G1YQC0_9BACT|nr:MAG: hypothetical protein A2912_03655 [Candidatus Buchananbacteria bacterium RIFCSPLOWO2_01_FULL_40_23b]